MTISCPPPGNAYLCDLCSRLRPGLSRAVGVRFFDCHWACQRCVEIYDCCRLSAKDNNHGA